MLTQTCQRWRAHRSSYRVAGEPFDPSTHEAGPVERALARAFVADHHYEQTFPAARFSFGLHARGGALVGVAVFAVPFRAASLDVLPCAADEGVVLSRFVLLDHVRANAESWFLARCFEGLRNEGIEGIVSFSDPMPRTDVGGAVVMPGHVGTIYQATNAVYCGQSKAEWRFLMPDARMVQARSLSKIRNREQGRAYGARQLVGLGADPLPDDATQAQAQAWVKHWTRALCRRVKHPGNHKYAWMLQRRMRRHLPPSRPYPKVVAPVQIALPAMEAA